jgi:Flp pilus assembly protein CpaB
MKLPPGSKYFLLAGVVGLAAVFLVHRFITSSVRIPVIPSSQLVVAEADIAPGTALAGRLLRVATWPRDIIPPRAVTSVKELEGRVAQTPIAKGEPILLSAGPGRHGRRPGDSWNQIPGGDGQNR